MKIICVGRNYLAHVKELDNALPTEPMFFMKPETALLQKKNRIPKVINRVGITEIFCKNRYKFLYLQGFDSILYKKSRHCCRLFSLN